MAEAMLERKPKKKTEKKKKKARTETPVLKDESEPPVLSLRREKSFHNEVTPTSKTSNQKDDTDLQPYSGITTENAEFKAHNFTPHLSKEELSVKNLGCKDPGESARVHIPEHVQQETKHEASDFSNQELVQVEPVEIGKTGIQSSLGEEKIQQVSAKKTKNETSDLLEQDLGRDCEDRWTLREEVSKNITDLSITSKENEPVTISIAEPITGATKLASTGDLNEVAIVNQTLPTNPYENLRAELKCVVHDYPILKDQSDDFKDEVKEVEDLSESSLISNVAQETITSEDDKIAKFSLASSDSMYIQEEVGNVSVIPESIEISEQLTPDAVNERDNSENETTKPISADNESELNLHAPGVAVVTENIGLDCESKVSREDAGTLKVTSEDAGTLEVTREADGTLEVTREDDGTLEVTSEDAGTLEVTREDDGTLEVTREDDGTLEVTSEDAGTLEVTREDDGTLEVSSEDAGTLEVTREDIGTLEVTREDAGTIEVTREDAGTLEVSREDAGSIEVTREDAGTLEVTREDAGTLEVTREDAGTLEVTREDAGTVEQKIVASENLAEAKTQQLQPAVASPLQHCQITTPDKKIERINQGKTKTPKVQHRKIYGEQSHTKDITSTPFRPLTIKQLESLYYNPQLAQNEQFVETFVQSEISKQTHEFYEILMDYFRARMNFLNAEGDIRSLQKNLHGLFEILWLNMEQKITVQGHCGDNVKCSHTHMYNQCKLNEETLQNISHVLQAIRTQLHEQFSLHAYSAQLSRFQVESYLHNMFMTSPVLRDIPRNAPVQALEYGPQEHSDLHQIHRLRECISILFMFHRRPIKDKHFVQDIRIWTERLTSALLRVASFKDHLFLLNHILRCPAGVGKWAGKLIQIPPPICNPQSTSFGSPVLDHAMTVLATILLPIKQREEFMCQMNIKSSMTPSEEKEELWILVDSDGEQDEDPANSWQYLHENDLVAFLKQFPTADIFRHVFIMEAYNNSLNAYDVQRTSDSVMMRVFAFATSFVRLLSSGLATFSMSRYRQLNKRLGRMIRQTVHYVSCHWQNFKTLHHQVTPPTIARLQLEFDQFFLRATHAIITAEKLGSWQFVADMPFFGVSIETMWRLLWVLHQNSTHSLDLDDIPKMNTCIEYMKDSGNLLEFADNLVQLPTSESIYLLTTFSNMAQSQGEKEGLFVQVIVLEVFEIAYISSHTRDFCSKVGRELLSAMAAAHPFIISILIQRLKSVMEEIGMESQYDSIQMCLYLFHEMPLYLWKPTEADISVLGGWLLDSSLHHPQNHLSRLILSNLNWGLTKQEDCLTLPVSLHRLVGLLLVKAYAKFVADKNAGYAVLQGMKQVASVVRNQLTNEQQFNIWVWDLALRLHLHNMSLPSPALLFGDQTSGETIFDVDNDISLLPLLKSIKADNSMACFVALAMTKYGHDISSFTSVGLDVLMTLSTQYQHHAVIKLLSCIIPMFYTQPQYLYNNDRFIKIIRQTISADDTYLKYAKSMIVNMFPGETIKLFSDMIQTQVNRGSSPAGVGGTVVLIFWVTLLTKSPKWFQDRNGCYLLDNLIKSAFCQPKARESIKDLFRDIFKNHLKENGGHGVVSSLVNWIASGTFLPSFTEKSSSEFVWLAYIVLETEAEFEQSSKLWKTIQQELILDNSVLIEQALKKAVTKLHMLSAPAIHRLNIYRWGQQALDTPIDHALMPVFWQRFFVLYLGRLTAEAGMPQRASIGEKFFETSANVTILKKMKKKLSEASEYHLKIVTESETRSRSQSTGAASNPDEGDNEEDLFEDRSENNTYIPNVNFHQRLASLYRTFLLWMDEPRLHDATLYLPSLPPQYEAARLQRVFHSQVDPWMEYVDLDKTEYELGHMVSEWVKRSGLRGYHSKHPHINIDCQLQTATEQILQRLGNHDIPDAPPPISPLKAPVPDVSVQVLEDKQAILYILNADLNNLKEYSKLFMSRMSKHMALDVNYLELLPEEYYNQRRQITLTSECKRSFHPTHKCKKPAVFQAEIEEKTRNEMIQRRLDENRAEFKQVMIEALLPPPPNICMAAVHVENVIIMLVKLCQTSTDYQRVTNLQQIASTLFYHLASMINDETNYYPPTRQFFSSCIEVLGQEFIRYNHDQVYTLLEFALSNPTLAGLLSPHFVPNHSPQYFINMYVQVSQVSLDKQPDMAFTFLSKFEVATWLSSSKPSHGEITHFLSILTTALSGCGAKPNAKQGMMLELYCSHLKAVLGYRFPQFIEEGLDHLLEGSSTESLNTRCWETFCEVCLGKKRSGSQPELPPIAGNSSVIQTDPKALLSITQIQRLLEHLASFFTRLRTSNNDIATFGLYPKWGQYSSYIGEIIHELVKDLSVKIGLTIVDWSPQRAVEFVWHHLTESFSPWIQPFDNQPEILSPWLENDAPVAMEMVALFREDVAFIHNHFSGVLLPYSYDVLSMLWAYYCDNLSPLGTPDFVMTVYHCEFENLAWETLQPSMTVIDSMAKLKEKKCDHSFLFLSRVFPRINWLHVIEYHMSSQPASVTASLETALFTLLLQFYSEKELLDTQNGSLTQVFHQAEGLNWGFLDSKSYCNVTNWLLQNSDPAAILAERSSNAALGPRLMRSAAGFTVPSSVNWQPDMSVKRVNYIHCVVQLLCQCTFQNHHHTDSFNTAIINLLTEIETVEAAVANYPVQQQESLDMVKQVFSLLNNCNPDGNAIVVVMATIVQWLQSSPNSILLMPCLKAASCSLASLSHMTQISETCIETYFSSTIDSSDMSGWGVVLAALQIPELSIEEYFREALQGGAFLTLFSYVLQRLPLCQNLQDEQVLLNRFIDWFKMAKPSSENEAKLILWSHKFLTLLLRQVDYGSSPRTSVELVNALIPSLTRLGEDRSTSGLLGAIGLGRKSPLSHKLRVFSRALAAFLSIQIQNDGTLILTPGALKTTSFQRKQTLAQLHTIRTNKEYGQYRDHIEFAWNFIQDETNTLRESVSLVVHLAHSLYPGQGYLTDVQHLQ